jgi:hypothetical protein
MPPNPQLVQDMMQARHSQRDPTNISGSMSNDMRFHVRSLREELQDLEERLTRLERQIERDSTLRHSRLNDGTGSGNDGANSETGAQHSSNNSNAESGISPASVSDTDEQVTVGETRSVTHSTSNNYGAHDRAIQHEHSGTGGIGAVTESSEGHKTREVDC